MQNFAGCFLFQITKNIFIWIFEPYLFVQDTFAICVC
jgi:hypothetical protein